jgi:hypothetical protein
MAWQQAQVPRAVRGVRAIGMKASLMGAKHTYHLELGMPELSQPSRTHGELWEGIVATGLRKLCNEHLELLLAIGRTNDSVERSAFPAKHDRRNK